MQGALAGLSLCLAMTGPASASFLQVTVTGIPSDAGVLACGLHDSTSGFPARTPVAQSRSLPVDGRAECRFDDLPPGRYAVAVLHDANGNGRMDTNVLGIPAEAWGTSGPRAPLRLPRFDEAAFDMGTAPARLRIRLNR